MDPGEKVFDVFCSYNAKSSGRIVVETSQKLISKTWDVIVDRYQKLYLKDSKADIDRSKVFLCFFTSDYYNQPACIKKLQYAKKSKKRIIIVYLEKMNHYNLENSVKTIIENSSKVIAYDEPNNLSNWFDLLFNQLLIEIEKFDQMTKKTKADYFKVTVESELKHDIFMSFDEENKLLISSIKDELQKKELQIWADINHIYKPTETLHVEIDEAILESRIVICFLTNQYSISHRCMLELKYAILNKKKCILVVLEDFDLGLGGLGVYIVGPLRLNAYEELNSLEEWPNSLNEKLFSLIRKLYCQLYVKEDIKSIDDTSELMNFYRKFRRIVLECSILRENSIKLRTETGKKPTNHNIDVFMKMFESKNKAINEQKKEVISLNKRFDDKQKFVTEKFKIYKHALKSTEDPKRNKNDDKKRFKLVAIELQNIIDKRKFLLREHLLLLDELALNCAEQSILSNLKESIDDLSFNTQVTRINNESTLLFKLFRELLDQEKSLAEEEA